MNNKLLGIGVVVALLLGLGGIFLDGNDPKVGSVASPDVYSYMNVHGAFSQGGGVTTVTPTNTAVTLAFADMVDANILTFSASSTQGALTVTLPASTTIPVLQEAGAYRTWVIQNPFTGAATTTTIAAGTGINLQEPDGQNIVIGATGYAWLTCYRDAVTDVICRVDETIDAD